MKNIFLRIIYLFVTVLMTTVSIGQKTSANENVSSSSLKGDTLYTAEGLKIFAGQQLIVGQPSGNDGLYRSIISKKAAIVPSIWGQDKRYENAIENYVDSKKNKEKLSQFLKTANSLTIKKIGLSKNGKPYFYMVLLTSDKEECKADIELALKLKELLLKQ